MDTVIWIEDDTGCRVIARERLYMKYKFSVNIYEDEQTPLGVIEQEIDADTLEDACQIGRKIMGVDIPELARKGIISGDTLIESRFNLEKIS